MALRPIHDGRQDLYHKLFFVANEVVIHEEQLAAPAGRIDGVQLPEDLPDLFRARRVARKAS